MIDKAKIIKVGGFTTTCIGMQPVGWEFDCGRNIPVLDIGTDAIRWGGWTVKELQEIAIRPSEFVDVELSE